MLPLLFHCIMCMLQAFASKEAYSQLKAQAAQSDSQPAAVRAELAASQLRYCELEGSASQLQAQMTTAGADAGHSMPQVCFKKTLLASHLLWDGQAVQLSSEVTMLTLKMCIHQALLMASASTRVRHGPINAWNTAWSSYIFAPDNHCVMSSRGHKMARVSEVLQSSRLVSRRTVLWAPLLTSSGKICKSKG